ncbi:MAG: cyclic nucleotide-binding domain-containing protein [Candidatus Sericytochromatia bacterium]
MTRAQSRQSHFQTKTQAGIPLPADLLATLQQLAFVHQVPTGQDLFLQGDVPEGLFILLSGEVELRDAAGPYLLVSDGSFLGLAAFLRRQPSQLSATTRRDCTIGFLSRPMYERCFGPARPLAVAVN